MNKILAAVLLILVVMALIGLKRGLIKTVFSLVSTIVALILTILLSPLVSNWMQSSNTISQFFTDKVKETVPIEQTDTARKTDEEIIESLGLPGYLEETLLKNNTPVIYNELEVKKNSIKEYIVAGVVNIAINAIAFLATFLIIRIALWLLCYFLDLISKLPVLRQVNKIAGLVAGLFQGLLYVWIFCILLMVFGFGDFGAYVYECINESRILTFIYESNLLVKAISTLG